MNREVKFFVKIHFFFLFFFFFFFGGGGGVRSGDVPGRGSGTQGGCEQRTEVFVKIQNYFFFFGGGGLGRVCVCVCVGGGGGGQGGCERRIVVFGVNSKK